ncbi:MAG: hypothetical protein E7038_02865 [Lentisphaerae bacterium]|nr:hypothetical protein [Lentisphaerota bacterium]
MSEEQKENKCEEFGENTSCEPTVKPAAKPVVKPGMKRVAKPAVKLAVPSRNAQTAKAVERFQSHTRNQNKAGCLRIIVIMLAALVAMYLLPPILTGVVWIILIIVLIKTNSSANRILKRDYRETAEDAKKENEQS